MQTIPTPTPPPPLPSMKSNLSDVYFKPKKILNKNTYILLQQPLKLKKGSSRETLR